MLVGARLARLTNLVDLYQFFGGGWIEDTGDAGELALVLLPTAVGDLCPLTRSVGSPT